MSAALLYVNSFTAADGTTRRPLIERVAECRPRRAEPIGPDRLLTCRKDDDGSFDFWFPEFTDGGTPAIISLDEEINEDDWYCLLDTEAEVHMRCAVEDWLFATIGGYSPMKDAAGEIVIWNSISKMGHGQTIHHALVMAAHRNADQKGIAP